MNNDQVRGLFNAPPERLHLTKMRLRFTRDGIARCDFGRGVEYQMIARSRGFGPLPGSAIGESAYAQHRNEKGARFKNRQPSGRKGMV